MVRGPTGTATAVALAACFLLLSATGQPARGDIGAWSGAANYPLSVDDESCVAYQSFVYCVGGFVGDTYTTNGTQSTDSVFYSAPSPSGGIASWSNTTAYPVIVNTHSCVAYAGFIYCVGGYADREVTNASYFAALLPSGGIARWSATTSYPFPTFSQSCAEWGGFIYCVGGYLKSGLPTSMVYYAELSTSGIGAWRATASYPTNVTSQSCVPASGFLYCIGGITDSEPPVSNAVYFASLSAAGASKWSNTTAYPTSIDIQSCVTEAGEVYCVGGAPNFAATDAVYYASVSASGGLGTWTRGSGYPSIVGELRCVPLSPYVYCVGGSSSASDHTFRVYYSKVASPPVGSTTAAGSVSTEQSSSAAITPASAASLGSTYLGLAAAFLPAFVLFALAAARRRDRSGVTYQGLSTGTGCSSPSTGMFLPLIQFARGEARNTTMSATSSGFPRRPIGKPFFTYASKSAGFLIL